MPVYPLTPRIAQWRTEFGNRLRALREQAGLSQEALAERAGVDRKLIYRAELGQTSPRLDTVVSIADALEVPVRKVLAD